WLLSFRVGSARLVALTVSTCVVSKTSARSASSGLHQALYCQWYRPKGLSMQPPNSCVQESKNGTVGSSLQPHPTASSSRFGRHPTGSAIQRLMSDSCQPAPLVLILS